MVDLRKSFSFCLTVFVLAVLSRADAQVSPARQIALPAPLEVVKGEKLNPSTFSPTVVEDMAAVLERERLTANTQQVNPKGRNGEPGSWVVPSTRAMSKAHSGSNHITNKWGDTELGIKFPELVNIQGAYFAGLGDPSVWTNQIKVIGYRKSVEVASSDWFTKITDEPTWFDVNLQAVDRIVVVAGKVLNGAGWYTLDDLTFTTNGKPNQPPVVLDFDDLKPGSDLSGTNYGGLTWETGTGNFNEVVIQSPSFPIGYVRDDIAGVTQTPLAASGTNGTAPQLISQFQGASRGDLNQFSAPPDSHGAIGPNHFVEVVNTTFSVFDKTNGSLLTKASLGAFLPGSSGDSRIIFDQFSGRWVMINSDFVSKLFVAVSNTDNPLGSWNKLNFTAAAGFDAGTLPDYPTLGVDQNGIYIGAFMAGSTMTVFAIDKAPLLVPGGNFGTITAFRGLPFEGAIQPVHTYGNTASTEYFVSRSGPTSIRVRGLSGTITNPTLVTLGFVTVPANSSPPLALALGSTTPLDTVGTRLMNAVFNNGSIWTTHTILAGSRSGVRWYELDPVSLTLIQSGTIATPGVYYLFPSIMVDGLGNALLAFSGSSAAMFPGAFYVGRFVTDPLGEMSAPVEMKAGTGPQNIIDQFGRNRFGDYSYTSLDPVDETLWTVQEIGLPNNFGTSIWGTWIAKFQANSCFPPTGAQFASHSFTVQTAPGTDPIALRVDGDPGDPLIACVSKFVQADGTLGVTPVFQLPAVWNGITVSGAELLPSSAPPAPARVYSIFAECQNSGFISAGRSVSMTLWADLDGSGEHSISDIVLGIIFVTANNLDAMSFASADVGGCGPSGELDIADIVQIINIATIYGGSYENSPCAGPCS